MRLKEAVFELTSSVAGGAIGFAAAYLAFIRIPWLERVTFRDERGLVLFPLFTGLPLGSVVGIALARRFFAPFPGVTVMALLVGLLAGVAASLAGVWLLPLIAGFGLSMVPALVFVCVFPGYRLVPSKNASEPEEAVAEATAGKE